MGLKANTLIRKGHRAVARGDLARALALLDEAARSAPTDRRCLIQRAVAFVRSGDCQAALSAANEMIERFADDPIVLLFAGRCRLECDDVEGAEPMLRRAAEADPENRVVQGYVALCRLMKGEIDKAAAAIDEAMVSGNADLLALMAHQIELRLSRLRGACEAPAPRAGERVVGLVAQVEQRVERSGQRGLLGRFRRRRAIQALNRLGERAFDRGDYTGAIEAFRAARRIGSTLPLTLLGEGLSALQLGRGKDAAQVLAAAFARWPDDGSIASGYAVALYRVGLFGEALRVFESIEPAGPDDFHAHYGRGACLAALGRKRESLEQFRTAFERYRLDAVEDCLIPSWHELMGKMRTEQNGSRSV